MVSKKHKFYEEGFYYTITGLLITLLIWYLLTIPLKGFLPTPHKVFENLFINIFTFETYTHVWLTMRRIAISFLGALILGVGLGIWMGNKKASESFFLPWVVVALAVPGPVAIIMSILILGIKESSTLIAAVVLVTPFVTNIIYQGVRSMDPKLNQMSKLYRLNKRNYLRQVILPQISPSILAALRTGFSIAWKEVVLIEALSQPNGIGAQILSYYKLLQPAQVLAWTILFTLIMFVIEFGVFRPIEGKVMRWRKAPQM